MNRVEIEAAVAEKTGLKKKDVSEVIGSMIETVEGCLVAGDDVRLVGFGKFSVSNTKERVGRSPVDGTPVTIPASKRVSFKPGKNLKDLLRG